jgi:uncharacterized protein
MTFEVRVARTMQDVDREGWDALAAAYTYYSSSDWLHWLEVSEGTRHETAYHQVWDGDTLVGALPSYWVTDETSGPYQLPIMAGGQWNGRKVLLGGGRRAYLSEWLLHPRLTGEQRPAAIRALARSLRERAAEVDADTVVLPYLTHTAMTELAAEGMIGAPFLGSADASIPLPEPSFEDYLARLPSFRRREIRREMRRFAEAGYTVTTESLGDCGEEVAELHSNLQRKYAGDAAAEPARESVRGQAELLAEHSLVFAARRDGRLVAFALAFPWQDRLFMRYTGEDYELGHGAFAYFNLTYYLPLQYACEHRFREVHLGLASLDAKTTRGAVLTPIWSAELIDGIARSDGDVRAEAEAAKAHNDGLFDQLRATPRIRVEAFDTDIWTALGR